MTVTGIGSQIGADRAVAGRHARQLDDLQRQLGTGQKSETTPASGSIAALRSDCERNSPRRAFRQRISNVGYALISHRTRWPDGRIGHESRPRLHAAGIDGSGQTVGQRRRIPSSTNCSACSTRKAGDHYLFSGAAPTSRPSTRATTS